MGQASTRLPRGFCILDDRKTEDVDTGVAVFECWVGYTAQTRGEVAQMCQAGNYLLRSTDGETEFYTIIECEEDTKRRELYVYAEDAGLDLLNEVAGPFAAGEAHTAEWYVSKYTKETGFVIGVNEIPAESVRTLSWDGEQTVTQRLASIATQFGGFEVSYRFSVRGLSVIQKYIDLYQQRGKETGVSLRLHREVGQIVTRTSIANLATALEVEGGTPEGAETPITLKGYAYDDGDCYVDGTQLKCRSALAQWSRFNWERQTAYEGHIVRRYSYDTTSRQTLCAHAVTQLQRQSQPEVNYEVELLTLPEGVKVGDRVNLVDDAGGLYLSARILKSLRAGESRRQPSATT